MPLKRPTIVPVIVMKISRRRRGGGGCYLNFVPEKSLKEDAVMKQLSNFKLIKSRKSKH